MMLVHPLPVWIRRQKWASRSWYGSRRHTRIVFFAMGDQWNKISPTYWSWAAEFDFLLFNPVRPTHCFSDTPLCRFFLSLNIASFAWNFRRKLHRARCTLFKFFFYIFIKTVDSMKGQTHLSHFDAKMYFLKLILHIFQINLTPFYYRIL